jgi:hypothetical protein
MMGITGDGDTHRFSTCERAGRVRKIKAIVIELSLCSRSFCDDGRVSL